MRLINFILPSLKAQLSQGHINAEELAQKIQNYNGSEGYYSLFDLEPRESFKEYRGFHAPALGYYVLDFDSSQQMELAQHDCLQAIQKLNLPEGSFKIYFSGNKGFHLYIRSEFFPISPSESTAKQFEKVAVRIAKQFSLETLDDSIYQANRKFRIPNSKHPKTGLYKIELTLSELSNLDVETIRTIAQSPRPITLFEYITPNTKYIMGNVSGDSVALSSQTRLNPSDYGLSEEPNLFATYAKKACITAMQATKHKEGMRHEVAMALISDYFHQGKEESETAQLIEAYCSTQGIEDRFERDYLRAIKDIYSGGSAYKFGCYSKIKQKFCSGTCGLYKKLDPSKRAEVTDLPSPSVSLSPINKNQGGEVSVSNDTGVLNFPDMGRNAPLSTIPNIKALLDFYGIEVGYNLIKKDIQIVIPNLSLLKDNAKSNSLVHIVSLASTHKLPRGGVEEFVEYIASESPFNPAVRWITSSPWDGISRLEDFYATLTTKASDERLKKTLIKKWMLSAIAAAFSPNGSAGSGILVLQGDQYIGKTKWFKELVPSELEITKDGMMLDPKDKDSVYQCVTNWLVELGEVDATFRKADIAHLKAFLTKDTDVLRLAYSRKTSEFARRTVFFASVNQEDYLSDPTGNRRFWTIECQSINHTHGLPMQQIWAEFYELWKKGETHFLTKDEMLALNRHNEAYQIKDAFEELFYEKFIKDSPNQSFMTSTEILQHIGLNVPNSRDYSRLRAVMKNLKVNPARNAAGVRGYMVAKKDPNDDESMKQGF